MSTKSKHEVMKLIQAAKKYFSSCAPSQKPPVLQGGNGWMALNGEWYFALFCLTEQSIKRVQEYKTKKWHPFPGLFSPSESGAALIAIDSTDNFFDSNMTQNGLAFNVGRKSSFILLNHRHSITDAKGNKADYIVDLAFVVGIDTISTFKTPEDAFIHLFEYLTKVWSSRR